MIMLHEPLSSFFKNSAILSGSQSHDDLRLRVFYQCTSEYLAMMRMITTMSGIGQYHISCSEICQRICLLRFHKGYRWMIFKTMIFDHFEMRQQQNGRASCRER